MSASSKPEAAPQATGWKVEHRTGTGLFVVSRSDTLLFRFDPQTRTIYSYDKKAKCEVAVKVDDLRSLPVMAV